MLISQEKPHTDTLEMSICSSISLFVLSDSESLNRNREQASFKFISIKVVAELDRHNQEKVESPDAGATRRTWLYLIPHISKVMKQKY